MICYSGGAIGADTFWKEEGLRYGVETIDFGPKDYQLASKDKKDLINNAIIEAARVLKRPRDFNGIDFVRRNWLQVENADAVFAVGSIIEVGEPDPDFPHMTDRQSLNGGTGWAIEFAIQMRKPIYVFDQPTDLWYNFKWQAYGAGTRFTTPVMNEGQYIPLLRNKFAGIGSRDLKENGRKAIEKIYRYNFAIRGIESTSAN